MVKKKKLLLFIIHCSVSTRSAGLRRPHVRNVHYDGKCAHVSPFKFARLMSKLSVLGKINDVGIVYRSHMFTSSLTSVQSAESVGYGRRKQPDRDHERVAAVLVSAAWASHHRRLNISRTEYCRLFYSSSLSSL